MIALSIEIPQRGLLLQTDLALDLVVTLVQERTLKLVLTLLQLQRGLQPQIGILFAALV